MPYLRVWERLPDAVARVVSVTGQSVDQAQADICHAIADRAVKIRAKLKGHTTRRLMTSTSVLDGSDFQIPTNLRPSDLDWEQSRPTKPWRVTRQSNFALPGDWSLDWIEVAIADVTAALCAGAQRQEPAQRPAGGSRARPAFESVQCAIIELYPQGVPSQASEPNKILCRHVGNQLKERGLPGVSDDTILRAAGRRRR